MKKHPLPFILIGLLLLVAIGELIHSTLDRMAEKQKGGDNTDNTENSDVVSGAAAGATAGSITNPVSISQTVKTQVVPTYTVAQLKAMVPDSISESTNQLTPDEWNNIADLANKLSSDKFSALQTQLSGITTMQAWTINLLPTTTLYNAIISRLQND